MALFSSFLRSQETTHHPPSSPSFHPLRNPRADRYHPSARLSLPLATANKLKQTLHWCSVVLTLDWARSIQSLQQLPYYIVYRDINRSTSLKMDYETSTLKLPNSYPTAPETTSKVNIIMATYISKLVKF